MTIANRSRELNLIHDLPISGSAFAYIKNRKYSTEEPFHVTLDRILKQHERLVNSYNLGQKERDEKEIFEI
jgi:hypothetical protein